VDACPELDVAVGVAATVDPAVQSSQCASASVARVTVEPLLD